MRVLHTWIIMSMMDLLEEHPHPTRTRLGGRLLEELLYDEDGKPRNANFMDYGVPGIDNIPHAILVEHMESRRLLGQGPARGLLADRHGPALHPARGLPAGMRR
jgi:hypothetical protein